MWLSIPYIPSQRHDVLHGLFTYQAARTLFVQIDPTNLSQAASRSSLRHSSQYSCSQPHSACTGRSVASGQNVRQR